MNRGITFNLSLVAFALASTAMAGMLSGAANAQTAKDLVGTWQLVSSANTGPNGKKIDTFGAHGTGMVIFDADGHFVLINGNPDVPKLASNNRAHVSPLPRLLTSSNSAAFVVAAPSRGYSPDQNIAPSTETVMLCESRSI